MPTYKVTGTLILDATVPTSRTINSQVYAPNADQAQAIAATYGATIGHREYPARWQQPPQVEEVPRGR